MWVKAERDEGGTPTGVSVGVWKIHPGHNPADISEYTAEFLGGVILGPEQAYEIAQRLTLCGIKVEEAEKEDE